MDMWNQWTKMDMESIELENIYVLVEKIYNHGTHIDPGTHTQSQRCVQNRGCPWSPETNTELGTQMESMDVHKPQTYMKLGYTHGTRDHTWN